MTDTLDLDALKADLQHQLDRTRRLPSEPLISISAEKLRAIISAAMERDALKAKFEAEYGVTDAFEAECKTSDALRAKLALAEKALEFYVCAEGCDEDACPIRRYDGGVHCGSRATRALFAIRQPTSGEPA